MAKIFWTISNITCATCANTIKKSLEQQQQTSVKVSIADGRVVFEHNEQVPEHLLQKDIQQLGYHFVSQQPNAHSPIKKSLIDMFRNNWTLQFFICLACTLPLLLHMFIHVEVLMRPVVQFLLALPVYVIGVFVFGKSALRSIRNLSPNMDVLIVMGSSAAFLYSTVGCFFLDSVNYLFFETSASIFTLVLLGNWLEHRSVQVTQREVQKLIQRQSTKATMIAFDDKHREQLLEVEAKDLRVGDLIFIKSGQQVPADAKILSGSAQFNEAIITGESTPLHKKEKDKIIGGSIVEDGNVRAQVTAVGETSILGNIIQSVREAELEKPPIQILADRISAVFVPLVLFLAGITFLGNYYLGHGFEGSLMRAIAVLVIACPCALGLATPAAIAVGLGRAAKMGIMFRQAQSLEKCHQIKQIAFDKTGTLTTGNLTIQDVYCPHIQEEELKQIVVSIEKFSTHPIAVSVLRAWHHVLPIALKNVQEIKGVGMFAQDNEGNEYQLGSQKIIVGLEGENIEPHKSIYVLKNKQFIAWIDLQDELRPDARETIRAFQQQNMKVFLISGDNELKCKQIATQLGITHYYAQQSPVQKTQLLKQLQLQAPTVMVGDGINDAPALAQASIGISMNGASQISIEAASIVLMTPNLHNVSKAIQLGKHTYRTIQENLFWAFAYNIVAIPVAAFGYLSPIFGALVMGMSDVVLALNSLRLLIKKIR